MESEIEESNEDNQIHQTEEVEIIEDQQNTDNPPTNSESMRDVENIQSTKVLDSVLEPVQSEEIKQNGEIVKKPEIQKNAEKKIDDKKTEEKIENVKKKKEEEKEKIDCLEMDIKSGTVTNEMIQYLVVHSEYLTENLNENIRIKLGKDRIERFFENHLLKNDLLKSFPLLRMIHQKYIPSQLSEDEFWERFVWFIHYQYFLLNKNLISSDGDIFTDIEYDGDNPLINRELPQNIVKFDYHSVKRYIASSILSILKVFIVCAVLKAYEAPWYFYLYPALWVLITILIILRALQIQRQNNIVSDRLEKSREDGIEMHELESI